MKYLLILTALIIAGCNCSCKDGVICIGTNCSMCKCEVCDCSSLDKFKDVR